MKYKITKRDNKAEVFCLYEDGTYIVLDLIGDRPDEEILKDAYILSKSQARETYKGEHIEDLKTYVPTPKEVRLDVDFYGLTGKVYDQYGDVMDLPITFTIEGTDRAKIEDGKLVEGEVEEETSFFIVAKAGELEDRQERTLYPEIKVDPAPPHEEILEAKLKATSDRQDFIEDLIAEIAMKVYE